MGHRDEQEALRAKVEVLERDLADVRSELAKAKTSGTTRRDEPSRPGWAQRVQGRIADALVRALEVLDRPAKGWSRARALGFASVTALLVGGTVLGGVCFFAAVEGDADLTLGGGAAILWFIAGLPLSLWSAAFALRAPGSRGGATFGGFSAALIGLMGTNVAPMLWDAPRVLVRGYARGSLEEVAASPAAWAEISAWVDAGRVATDTDSTMRDGHMVSHSTSAAPLVPALGWNGPTSLFLCGDADDIAAMGAGSGVIAGRVEHATGTARGAIEATRVPLGPSPRCVTPTLGGLELTLAMGSVATALYLLILSLLSGWLTASIAGSKTG